MPFFNDLVNNIVQRNILGAEADVLLSVWLRVLRLIEPAALAEPTDMFGPLFERLYRLILQNFILAYIGPQPGAHRGWSRPRLSCNCELCWEMNLFLASATQQTFQYRATKNERHHMHVKLDGIGFDGTHATKRTYREPQTLIITKRDRIKEKHDAWVARCRKAYDEIQAFDQNGLRKLLGDEMYEDIVELRIVCMEAMQVPGLEFLTRRKPLGEVRNPPPPPPPGAPIVPSPRVGEKRKAEVIDLCGDSD